MAVTKISHNSHNTRRSDGDFLQESKDILMEYHSFEEYLKKQRRG